MKAFLDALINILSFYILLLIKVDGQAGSKTSAPAIKSIHSSILSFNYSYSIFCSKCISQ